MQAILGVSHQSEKFLDGNADLCTGHNVEAQTAATKLDANCSLK